MFKVAALMALFLIPAPASAQQTYELSLSGQTFVRPVPEGYDAVPREAGQPSNVIILATTRVEPWERAAEFSEEILILAVESGASDHDVLEAEMTDVFDAFVAYAIASRDGQSEPSQETLAAPVVFDFLVRETVAADPLSVDVSARNRGSLGVVLTGSFVMPGVTSYPVIEEVSLLRQEDIVIIFIARRVNIDATVAPELRRTGRFLRGE